MNDDDLVDELPVEGSESGNLGADGPDPNEHDAEDFRGFCMNATAAQLLQIFRKEMAAGRRGYARIARWVAEQRGVMLDELG